MTKLSQRLLIGLAVTLSLVVAITVVHAQEQQGGADSPERQAVQNAENTPQPAAHDPSTCVASSLTLPSGVPVNVTAALVVVGPTVVLTFSTEVITSATGTVNLDYSIDGRSPVPIGPEFFAHDSPFFVTRTAQGATIPPFMTLGPGLHTIQPVLTAFGPGATVFFRCFTAVPG